MPPRAIVTFSGLPRGVRIWSLSNTMILRSSRANPRPMSFWAERPRNPDFVDETLFQLSRFIFLLLLAALISFAFPIIYHFSRRRIFHRTPSTKELRAQL